MNLTNLRIMMVLVLSFMGFLRLSELSNLRHSDSNLHNTHISIFIEKSKTDIYRKGHWVHLAKFNSNLCQTELTKRYFLLAGIDRQCDKYMVKPISYTTVTSQVLELLVNIGLLVSIGLDSKKFGLHSLRS